jgi:2',3'-cyclic-nucleotide 2'-phosphodiesterase (5'-nucleotidase family)
MDAGDVFARGPVAREYHGEPDFEAMNIIPYDVMTIGNNEFKGADGPEGQQILRERIKQARFPMVCANVLDQATGKPLVPPYVIFEAAGRKIGVFGLTAPRAAEYDQTKGLLIGDPIAAAREMVRELSEKADVIILLSHLGYPLDQMLASQVRGIDLIVGGDSHTWVDKPYVARAEGNPQAFWVGGSVIVQDGEFGSRLGRVDLYLRRSTGHDYQVMSVKGELVPVTAKTPDIASVDKMLKPYLRPFQKVVGNLDQPVPKEKAAAWTAEAMRTLLKTDVGVHSLSGIDTGLPAGPVTLYNLRGVYLFDNKVVVLRLTGAQLSDLLRQTECAAVGADNIDLQKTYTVAAEDYLLTNWPQSKSLEIRKTDERVFEFAVRYLQSAKSTKGVSR